MILAHAFGARYELPIPLALFVVGGAAVVIASFLLVAQRVASGDRPIEPDVTHVGRFRAVPAVISLVVLAGLIAAGLTGSQEVPENIVPTVFWLYVWVVLPLSCGVLGDWTQPINPFANLAKLADSDRVRRALLGSSRPLTWPRWLGWWPAVAVYFLAVCGELIYNITWTTPKNLAAAFIVYAIVSAACGLLFGRSWLERGEMFTVLYGTWGRLGWFRFGAPGRRRFAGGLDVTFEPTVSRIAFVLLLLVSVNFDGLLNTPTWTNLERNIHGGLVANPHQLEIFRTVSFAALAIVIFIGFGLFASAAAYAGGFEQGPRGALALLLPSLLPIAFGYLLSHYIEYVLINGQLILPLIGNPTGKESWPIHLPFPFNDSYEVHAHFLPNATYWYVALVVIVLVHVVAVFLAHHRLGYESRTPVRARRSEYPWLAAMVGYTMLSLWLIAQPLTKEKAAPAAAEESFGHHQPVAARLVADAPR